MQSLVKRARSQRLLESKRLSEAHRLTKSSSCRFERFDRDKDAFQLRSSAQDICAFVGVVAEELPYCIVHGSSKPGSVRLRLFSQKELMDIETLVRHNSIEYKYQCDIPRVYFVDASKYCTLSLSCGRASNLVMIMAFMSRRV